MLGSSPLTRGKPGDRARDARPEGLIPAHAGKTRARQGRQSQDWAHPRSRGENRGLTRDVAGNEGSSPLTRGKLSAARVRMTGMGLIPAHAGKTSAARAGGVPGWAHPRSRGENAQRFRAWPCRGGSSPLTRGKPPGPDLTPTALRLIPAHAGKTLSDLHFYRTDRSDLGKP